MVDHAHAGPTRFTSYERRLRTARRAQSVAAILFIPGVVYRRLSGAPARRDRSGADLSILAEARAEAGAVVPFIFMG